MNEVHTYATAFVIVAFALAATVTAIFSITTSRPISTGHRITGVALAGGFAVCVLFIIYAK